MFDARSHLPLTFAIADGAVVRVEASLPTTGLPGMARRTPSFPIRRGVTR